MRFAELDLRDLDLSGTTRRVRLTLGMGRADVWLPPGTRVHVHGHVGLGHIAGFGDEMTGDDGDQPEGDAGRKDRAHCDRRQSKRHAKASCWCTPTSVVTRGDAR